MTNAFPVSEKLLSQIPAIELLINMGFTWLPPPEAMNARGKRGNLILEEILREQLKKLNRIRFRGGTYRFSEENIQTAIQQLKGVKWDGLQRTNEAVYDLLTLGISLEQSIDGHQKSHTLRFIDWKNPEKNAFHLVPEFAVERTRSYETVRPDLVLFVNGIPFAVIECKSPQEELDQAISQMIRNQREDFIPRLFSYVQLVVAVNKNGLRHATVGTQKKFWSIWKEPLEEDRLAAYSKTMAIALSSDRFLRETAPEKLRGYKQDLARFTSLKAAVRLRYAEAVDYRDYEPKIKKLLDTHITAHDVTRLNEPLDILDDRAVQQVLGKKGPTKTTAAKADTIAHATRKTIHENLEQDPAFFEKFSKLIQDAIDAFHAQRISDLEYLNQVRKIREAVAHHRTDDLPARLQRNNDAAALFGVLRPLLECHFEDGGSATETTVDAALELLTIIRRHRKVDFWADLDAPKETINAIDDFMFGELKEKRGITLTLEEMDSIIDKTMTLARHRQIV